MSLILLVLLVLLVLLIFLSIIFFIMPKKKKNSEINKLWEKMRNLEAEAQKTGQLLLSCKTTKEELEKTINIINENIKEKTTELSNANNIYDTTFSNFQKEFREKIKGFKKNTTVWSLISSKNSEINNSTKYCALNESADCSIEDFKNYFNLLITTLNDVIGELNTLLTNLNDQLKDCNTQLVILKNERGEKEKNLNDLINRNNLVKDKITKLENNGQETKNKVVEIEKLMENIENLNNQVQIKPTPFLYLYNDSIVNPTYCLNFSLENFNCFSIWFNTSDLKSRGVLFGNFPKEGFNVEKTADNELRFHFFKPLNKENIFEIKFENLDLFELNKWVNLTVLLTTDNIKIFKNGNEILNSKELNYDLINKQLGDNYYCVGRDNRENYQDIMFRGEMCKLKFFNNSDIDNLIIEKIYEEEKKDILEMTITPFLVLYDKEIINNFNKCLGFSLENFNYFSIWFKMYYFKKQIFVLIGNWPENGLNIEITENGEIRIYLNKGEEREIYEVPGILNNSNFYNWTNLSIFLTLNDIEIYKNGMRVANSYELNYLKINTYLEKNNYCVGRDNRKDYREVLFNGEISKIKFYNNRTINQWVITQIYEKEKKELKLLV